MILESSIGVGIEGLEGRQAALASDVSILQFDQLNRLLLNNGRLCFYRTSQLVSFIIHRGSVLFFIQIFFMITNCYVPLFLYNGYLTLGYATVFTHMPVFSLIWDIDLPFGQIINYPILYSIGWRINGLTVKNFLFWIMQSLYQSLAIYSITWIFGEKTFKGLVTTSFTSLLLIELLNVYTNVQTFHWFIWSQLMLSALMYILCLFVAPDFFGLEMLSNR